MVEISRKSHTAEASSRKKPIWLFAVYGLFLLSCFNAFRTYKNQKELVRLEVENERENDSIETRYSAGAEENVVTAGVGSSQYGGSVRAADKKNNKRKKLSSTNFKGIRPEPSDGSKDYTKTHPPSDFKGFGFYVMADTPYTESVETKLQSQMAELQNISENNPESNLVFALHVGGTQKSSQCNESTYENRAKMISQWPSPPFVAPGTSDWFDCTKKDEAFGFFLKHLGPGLASQLEENQIETLNVERSEKNPELFRLLFEGILVIGLHVIDPPEEFVSSRDKRMETSMQWLAESVEEKFIQHEIRGVVIVGHAGKSERNKRFFSHVKKYFDDSTGRNKIPVLYLHGNGLEWALNKNSSPFYYVQMGKGDLAKPLIIDVAPQTNGKIQSLREDQSGMQTILKGLFRLDRRGIRNSEENP